jgi:hypothetical protein
MWDKKLWAVQFTGADGRTFLLGTRWHRAANVSNKGYPGEPSRALLFTARRFAREYCTDQRKAAQETGGVCAKWKYKPVRVRESVTALRRSEGL